jgi:hypothetical protein
MIYPLEEIPQDQAAGERLQVIAGPDLWLLPELAFLEA